MFKTMAKNENCDNNLYFINYTLKYRTFKIYLDIFSGKTMTHLSSLCLLYLVSRLKIYT